MVGPPGTRPVHYDDSFAHDLLFRKEPRVLPLILWLLVLEVLGLLALPLAIRLFRPLRDGGYAFAKTLGLVISVYVFWVLTTLTILPNNYPAIVLGLTLVAVPLGCLLYRDRLVIAALFQREKAAILTAEAVFVGAFLLFCLFRAAAPDVHLTQSMTITTEQPMDLAFLASTMRSPAYPPHDPWLSGHPISYYYMGYMTLGWLARLALAGPNIAYNLGLATIFALAAVGAYGVVYNTVRFSLGVRPRARLAARLSGVTGALFLVVWGNLVALLELLRAWGLVPAAILRWANVPGMTEPVAQTSLTPQPYWYWHASRVINDPLTDADPIDEFPAWSFNLGDLHPHLMDLAFVVLAIGLVLAFYLRKDVPRRTWLLERPWEAVLTGLVIGALGFVNSWDLPIYLVLFGGVLALRAAGRPGTWTARLADILVPVATVFGIAILLYLPFYAGLSTQAKGVLPLADTGSAPVDYLLLWGPFLAVIVPFAVILGYRFFGAMSRGDVAVALLPAVLPVLLWTLAALLIGVLGVTTVPFGLGDLLGDAQDRGMVYTLDQLPSAIPIRWLLVLPLAALIFFVTAALIYMSRNNGVRGWAFGLALALGGLLLAMTPELFYVVDLFGVRMNTVFKLHYQAWVLLSLAAAIGCAWLVVNFPAPGARFRRLALTGAGFVALCISGGVVFPLLAPAGPIGESSLPLALDGFQFYRDRFPEEAQAIEWLGRNAHPSAVIVESPVCTHCTPDKDYSDQARVASMTGLQTVVGWPGHELQWRGTFDPVAGRDQDVDGIYTSVDQGEVQSLLSKYNVTYVYVGRLEQERYGQDAAPGVREMLPVAYRNGSVTIYHNPRGWRPEQE